MIKVTFYAPSIHARHVQNLVKKYDGRFDCNPCLVLKKGLFVVTFEDVNNYNKFMPRADILSHRWF